jgi:hypothetical protein
MASGDKFTELHFLRKLQMVPISGSVTDFERVARDKHSNLVDTFKSYKENDVL